MLIFKIIRSFFYLMVSVGVLLILSVISASAGDPDSAYYSPDNNKIFWFIHISDTHIGARGTTDSDRLGWVITEGKNTIQPQFIVISGDLTDSTDGNLFSIPNGPWQSEWDEYQEILTQENPGAGVSALYDMVYDIPGNHDAYSDKFFEYYLLNSVQGQRYLDSGQSADENHVANYTQPSWTYEPSFGKYHFLGVNTADNTGESFWGPNWGDTAGLDGLELTYIENQLNLHADADLTFVFGHHPVTDPELGSTFTYMYYGATGFVEYLDDYGASFYGYGHNHVYEEEIFKGDSYTGTMIGKGVIYFNINSLGKAGEFEDDNNFSVIAVDCNGISIKTRAYNDSWPLVLITTPVDSHMGDDPNPYAYSVPNAADNPIRALVFDANNVSQVRYRIDSGEFQSMQQVAENPNLWEVTWNASGATEGEHTIEVQATGSSTSSDRITVNIASGNRAPSSDDQYIITDEDVGKDIQLTASDPDGDTLEYQIVNTPSHGLLDGTPPSVTYSPNPDYNGEDSFTFKAFDGSVDSNIATVDITIQPVNDLPDAVNDAYSIDEGDTLSVPAPGILGNDSDIDDDSLNVYSYVSPSHGNLTLNNDGSFVYYPDPGFTGLDGFTYVANDGYANSLSATVTITVNPVSIADTTPPEPNPMTWAAVPDKTGTASIIMTATTAADDSGVEYYFTCVSGGGHNSGWQSSPVYEDTGLLPNSSYSYTVRARDLSINQNETGASSEAFATTDSVNSPPYFTLDTIVEADATENVPYTGSIADYAGDPDSEDALIFSRISGPSWLTVATDGTLSGIPGTGDVGPNTWTVRVQDAATEFDEALLKITVNEAARESDFTAFEESTNMGSVSGSYLDTRASDNVYEELTEGIKAGKWSKLDHTWTFNITGNAATVIFMVEAYHSYNNEGDDFIFAWSTDNVVFNDMLTITSTYDDNTIHSFELPASTSGTIYIRVTDTDNTRGNTSLETLHVDEMLIFTTDSAQAPGTAFSPSPADGAANVDLNAQLTWSAGAGAEWHDVYFGTVSGYLGRVSTGQTDTIFDPGLLEEGTKYYWRIDEGNSTGTTAGTEWSFTTAGEICNPSTVHVNSIEISNLKGSAGRSIGQATVTVIDDCGNPVSGAYITGYFTGDFSSEMDLETYSDDNGEAVFNTTIEIKKPSYSFVVDSVSAEGLTWIR